MLWVLGWFLCFILWDCFCTRREEPYLYQRDGTEFCTTEMEKASAEIFGFSHQKHLTSKKKKKGSCVRGLPESFLSSSKSTDQLKGFFSGCHSQLKGTAEESLPQPSPPATITILFTEAQCCVPQLQIMV